MPANPPFKSVLSLFTSFISGLRLIDGGDLSQFAAFNHQTTSGLTALAGGGLSSSTTKLNFGYNEVSTCATDSDSVVLPYALPGAEITVWNDTAHTLAVFARLANPDNNNVDDLIVPQNSDSGAASQTVATVLVAKFICFKAGVWKMMLSA